MTRAHAQTIDISFLAMVEGGKNLAKVKVSNIDKKGVDQVATELDAGSQRLRKVHPSPTLAVGTARAARNERRHNTRTHRTRWAPPHL